MLKLLHVRIINEIRGCTGHKFYRFDGIETFQAHRMKNNVD